MENTQSGGDNARDHQVSHVENIEATATGSSEILFGFLDGVGVVS